MLASPFNLFDAMIEKIDREIDACESRKERPDRRQTQRAKRTADY